MRGGRLHVGRVWGADGNQARWNRQCHAGHGEKFILYGGNIKQDKCLEGKVVIKMKT